MQQGAGRFSSHSRVTVRRRCDHSFKQSQHAADLLLPIESGNQVHFGRAGIREADLHPSCNQRFDETLRSVHWFNDPVSLLTESSRK